MRIAASAMALTASTAAFAGGPWGVQLAGGVGDHDIRKLDLGVVWDPHLTWWDTGHWHFGLVVEGHLAWWHSSESGAVHANLAEAGVTPMVRFEKDSGAIRPYLEAGIGVRGLSHARVAADYTLSSAFQFADTVGIGAQFGQRQQYLAGLRFEHISNGGIKRPNPGINFSQLYVQYNF